MGKSELIFSQKMAKRTKKVGICGKFGVRYGASLRKIAKKFEISQHMRYMAPSGKMTLKRTCVGIWQCKKSGFKMAGGAWTPTTLVAQAAKTTMVRLKSCKLKRPIN